MKTLLLLGFLTLLQSCGALNDACNSNIRMGCNTIFGELPNHGDDGKDGLSLVSDSEHQQYLCDSVGGNKVTIAQDVNFNGILDADDKLQTQFIVCDGAKGDTGTSGLNCSVSKQASTATITCDGSSVQVLDGLDGAKGDKGDTGAQGPQGLSGSIVEVVELCPNSSSPHREIALRVAPNKVVVFLQQSDLVKVNAPGGQVEVLQNLSGRLTLLQNGFTYQTTDGNSCKFKVVNGNIQHL